MPHVTMMQDKHTTTARTDRTAATAKKNMSAKFFQCLFLPVVVIDCSPVGGCGAGANNDYNYIIHCIADTPIITVLPSYICVLGHL